LRATRAGSFRFVENAYRAGQLVGDHQHEHAFAYLVLDGESTDRVGGCVYTCPPQAVMFHPPGARHANEWRRAGRCFHIELLPDGLGMLGSRALPHPTTQQVADPAIIGLARRLHREAERADAVSPLAMEGLSLELVALLYRTPSAGTQGPRGWLGALAERLRESPAAELSLSRIAAEEGRHPAHVARAFRQAHGCSVGEFVRRARIEHACSMIRDGCTSVSTLALETGFHDGSHFSRCFKRVTGSTPSEYIARLGTFRSDRTDGASRVPTRASRRR
jgi:AraC family transcriptional regulator